MPRIIDGWMQGVERVPGPAEKKYAEPNEGLGIVWHSMEGWMEGSLAELQKPTRQASWMFSISLEGDILQHYPVTASPWASGTKQANTRFWSVETEGTKAMPLNRVQVTAAEDIIEAWQTHTGRVAKRPTTADVLSGTMLEHREVATLWAPNAGATACPSERYAPLWAALTEAETPPVIGAPEPDEGEVMLIELLLAMYAGREERDANGNLLPREDRVANAIYRMREAAEGRERSVADIAASAAKGNHTHAIGVPL